mmetsp:Transcript_96585/g.268472  ORF Transcript_96585/g.268472 Transcript_96585/m.268472 type:complete len:202 (-) Transcript_96585:234-839(-)
MMPTTSISVPTWSCPSLRDSAWAIITALMVFSVKRSNIIAMRVTTAGAPMDRAPGRATATLATEPPSSAQALTPCAAPQLLLASEPTPAALAAAAALADLRASYMPWGPLAAAPQANVQSSGEAARTTSGKGASRAPRRTEAPASARKPARPRPAATAAAAWGAAAALGLPSELPSSGTAPAGVPLLASDAKPNRKWPVPW